MKSSIGLAASRSKKEQATQGLGGLEAQKIPMLVLQMICCLLSDMPRDTLLPDNPAWMMRYCPWIRPEKCFSILDVVVKSGVTLLDLHHNLRRTSWQTSTILDLHNTIITTQFYFNLLWECKQSLLRARGSYSGWKPHMLSHLVEDILRFGPVQMYTMIW